jgi:hypothetical protein
VAISFDDARKTYDGLEVKNGRHYVIPPGGEPGGKTTPYTRCTTFVDAISSSYGLMNWEKRKLVRGLAIQHANGLEPLLRVGAHLDDLEKLEEVMQRALETGGADAAADAGTAMHAVFQNLDLGLDPGPIPPQFIPDYEARQRLVAGMKWLHVEQRVILDALKVTGTPDRVIEFPKGSRFDEVYFPGTSTPVAGSVVIGDDKTGKLDDYRIFKIAMQLAVYARSWLYDPATGERTVHGARTDWGLIIHTPVGEGVSTGLWVDLKKGWDGVMLCRAVRMSRNLKMKDLTHTFQPSAETLLLDSLIEAATSVEELHGVYEQFTDQWTAEHSRRAEIRKTQFSAATR